MWTHRLCMAARGLLVALLALLCLALPSAALQPPGLQQDLPSTDVRDASWAPTRAAAPEAESGATEPPGAGAPVGAEAEAPGGAYVSGYEPMAVAVVEPRLPEAVPVDAEWASLDQTVRQLAGEFSGRLSVVAVDLGGGSRYEFRPRDRYLPASTFKLPVTLCTLEAIDRGELTWESLVTYTSEDWEPVGAGAFDTASFGERYPVRNLLDRSLIYSNNVAVKMLARTLTWEGLLACTERIGGPVTRVPEGSTPVTAGDEAAWWLHIWRMHRERPALAEDVLRPLRQVAYHGRIQAGTPEGVPVTHKFGTYAGHDHDGAIVWGEHPYVLVVMTYGPSQAEAEYAIERIASAAWEAVQKAYGG